MWDMLISSLAAAGIAQGAAQKLDLLTWTSCWHHYSNIYHTTYVWSWITAVVYVGRVPEEIPRNHAIIALPILVLSTSTHLVWGSQRVRGIELESMTNLRNMQYPSLLDLLVLNRWVCFFACSQYFDNWNIHFSLHSWYYKHVLACFRGHHSFI